MSEQDNVRVATASMDALNARDLDKWMETVGPGFQGEGPGAPGPMNADEYKMYLQNFLTAWPDLHFDVKQTIAQGDLVVQNWVATGTNRGPLRTPSGSTIPATGTNGTTPGSTTMEFKNGRQVRSQTYWDMVGLLIQMGLMQPM